MDFPADITLRKTRMKFELTFKVVLLFSYQGFAFMRKLLYFITSTFVCQELFQVFNFFFEVILLSSSISFRISCSFMSCNFYILSHMLYLVKNFFSFIWRFSFRFLSNQCVLMCNVCYLIIEFVLRQVFFHFFIFSFRTFIYVLSESFFSSISHLT